MAARVRPAFSSHEELILHLFKQQVVTDTDALKAMLDVDRGDFAAQNPYQDRPQFIGYGTTISAPHMHAHALEHLACNLKSGMTAMDIGTGSGYLTCCMAQMVGSEGTVFGIDHIEELIDIATVNIIKHHSDLLQSHRLEMVCTDGRKGYPKGAPFDCIHVGAAADESVAKLLCQQLKNGGKLIMPVILKKGDDIAGGDHQVFREYNKNNEGEVMYSDIAAVRFNILCSESAQRNNGREQRQPVRNQGTFSIQKSKHQIEMDAAKQKMARMEIEAVIQNEMCQRLLACTLVLQAHNQKEDELEEKQKREQQLFLEKQETLHLEMTRLIKENESWKVDKARKEGMVRDLTNQVTILQTKVAELEDDEKQKTLEIASTAYTVANIEGVLSFLGNERESFREQFNEEVVHRLYTESPLKVIQRDSEWNQQLRSHEANLEQIVIAAKAFGKCIRDTKALIERVSRPDVREYRSWDLQQIMAWITALDDGKYSDHLGKLKEGFMKSRILKGVLLPELTRSDLSSPPFNIHEFVIKRDLETHFKSLVDPTCGGQMNEGAEETKGAYIM